MRTRHRIAQLLTVVVLALSMTGMVTLAAANSPSRTLENPAKLQALVDADICVALFQEGILDINGNVDVDGDLLTALLGLDLDVLEGVSLTSLVIDLLADGCVGQVDTDTGTDSATDIATDSATDIATDTAPDAVATVELCTTLFENNIIDVDGLVDIDLTPPYTQLLNLGLDVNLLSLVDILLNDGCAGLVDTDTGTDSATDIATDTGTDSATDIATDSATDTDTATGPIFVDLCVTLFQEDLIDVDGFVTIDETDPFAVLDLLATLQSLNLGVDAGDLLTFLLNDGCAGFQDTDTATDTGTATDTDTGPIFVDLCVTLFQEDLIDVDGFVTIDETDPFAVLGLLGALDDLNLGVDAGDLLTFLLNDGCAGFQDTDTDTATATDVDTDTATATDVDTDTATATDVDTDTATATDVDTDTATATDVDTDTATATDVDTDTATATDVDTDTATATDGDTDTATATDVDTDTATATDVDTDTATATDVDTDTATATDGETDTATDVDTDTATDVDTDTATEPDMTPGEIACATAIESASTGTGDFADYTLVFAQAGVPVDTGSDKQVIVGTEGDDVIDAGSGHDVICGYGGNDTILSGSGNDITVGGAGADDISAGSGRDTVYTDGNDTIDLGTGNRNQVIFD